MALDKCLEDRSSLCYPYNPHAVYHGINPSSEHLCCNRQAGRTQQALQHQHKERYFRERIKQLVSNSELRLSIQGW